MKFEGEILNGEINGMVKEYFINGNLKFRGQYLNGKRNGIGKEYDYTKNLIYEGEYLDGEQKPNYFDEHCINQWNM